MRTFSRALLGLLCFGCESIIGADFDVKEVQCTSAQPPERPTLRGEDREFGDYIFGALTQVDFGDQQLPDKTYGYSRIGFDLDRVCALQGARPSCTPFAWANPNVANGLDGRDNQAGALIRDQFGIFNKYSINSKILNDGIKDGSRAPLALVRVTRYNRESDDAHVEVDWYVPLAYGNAGAGAPTLGHSDVWPVSNETVDDPSALKSPPPAPYPPSKYRDPNAYVKNFEVVARLPKGTPFMLAAVPFTLDDMVVVLRLDGATATDERFYIAEGTLAGHYPVKELFRQMPRMAALFAGAPICTNQGAYPKVKKYFCAHVDSLADGRNAPDARCDALSVGVKFTASRAQMGVAGAEPQFAGCPADTNPVNDTCDIPAVE